MATKACRDCGQTVSYSAKRCPHCGASNPSVGKIAYAVCGLFGIVVAVTILSKCMGG